MIKIEDLKKIIALLTEEKTAEDMEKLEKGNASAGKRLRKILLEVGKLTKTARVQIQEQITAE